MLKFTGGTTKFNWMIAAQQNVNNGLEITPSSAAGGSTFSTPAVVITSGGNVGIGYTSPNYPLQVHSSTSISRIQLTNSSTGTASGDGFQIIADGVNATLSLPETGYMSFETSNAERMRITSGGDIVTNGGTAYGTATNRGTLTIYGSTDSQISLRSSTTGAGYIYHTGTNMEIYNTNSGYIKFATENAEVYRITKEAWFLIQNTAAAPTTNPVGAGYLYVQGGALKFRGSSGTVTTIANA
jgi:hypothetical protein